MKIKYRQQNPFAEQQSDETTTLEAQKWTGVVFVLTASPRFSCVREASVALINWANYYVPLGCVWSPGRGNYSATAIAEVAEGSRSRTASAAAAAAVGATAPWVKQDIQRDRKIELSFSPSQDNINRERES